MAHKATPRPRRAPRQARSQITVTAILDAALRVLTSQGYEKCTTNVVAEVAGVSIGSLYEYFPNKQALVAAVAEREFQRFLTFLQSEATAHFEKPFSVALRAWLDAALSYVERRRDFTRVLCAQYPHLSGLASRINYAEASAGLVPSLLRHWGLELRFEWALTGSAAVLGGMLASVIAAEVQSPTSLAARESLLDALSQLLLRLVRASSDGSVEAGGAAREKNTEHRARVLCGLAALGL